MATDFYSQQKKVPLAVKQRARHWIAKAVSYKGQRAVVIGKWWRRSTNEILYDLKQIVDGGPVEIYPKVPEDELTEV